MIQLLRSFLLGDVSARWAGWASAAGGGRCVRALLLVTMMVAPCMTEGQTLGEYVYSTGVDTTKWIDMDAATQILTPVGNDGLASSLQNIGFEFPFGEEDYSQFSVNTDGNLRLGATVTGTVGYSTPFSAANANTNNPKINAFGCDGYGVSGIHYVKALNTVDGSGRSLLVVEFCTGTYTYSTRNNLYKWQVHLYADGDIEIVYGPEPAAAPAAVHQCGLCVDASDGWAINAGHLATHFTSGYSSTIPTGNWPTEGRYYRFGIPVCSCPKPTSLACTDLTPYSFNLSWTDTSDATSWIVRMVGEDDSVVYDHVVNFSSASFTGLVPATIYTVRVAGLCQNGDTSRYRSLRVQTPCVPLTTLPYRMNFDSVDAVTTTSVAESNLPSCWTNYNTGTNTSYSGYPIVYNSAANAHSGTNSMRFYTYPTSGTYSDQMALLPMTDSVVLPLSAMQLSFWMRSTEAAYSSYVVVGVITDPTDPSTFRPIQTVPTYGSTTYEQHTVMLAAYHGPYGRVAIMAPQPASSYNALLIDDVVLAQAPSCLPVDSLTVSSITDTDATFDWTPVSMESAWELHVWFNGGLDSIYYAGTHPFSVGDLSAGIAYYASVRPRCGLTQDIVGDWGDTITFSTTVCPDVTGLTTSVDSNSVMLSWAANPLSENWIIEYGLQGFGQGEGITVISYDTTYTVSGLMYDMAYDFHVRAVCGTDWYSENWVIATATTEEQIPEDCDPVTELAVSNITATSALIFWTPSSMGEEWEVVLADAEGATLSEASTTDRQYQFSSLTSGTSYVAKVRTVCGDENFSDFVNISFTTEAVGIGEAEGVQCTIFPNPIWRSRPNGSNPPSATLTFSGMRGSVKIAVVDIAGREMVNETLDCSGDCAKTIDVEGFAQGAYFVRVTAENVSVVKKLIVR